MPQDSDFIKYIKGMLTKGAQSTSDAFGTLTGGGMNQATQGMQQGLTNAADYTSGLLGQAGNQPTQAVQQGQEMMQNQQAQQNGQGYRGAENLPRKGYELSDDESFGADDPINQGKFGGGYNYSEFNNKESEQYIMQQSLSPEGIDFDTMGDEEKDMYVKYLMNDESKNKDPGLNSYSKGKDMSTPSGIGLSGLIGMATKRF